MATEALFLRIKTRDSIRLCVRQEYRHHGPPLGVEIGADLHPVDAINSRMDRDGVCFRRRASGFGLRGSRIGNSSVHDGASTKIGSKDR